MRSLSRKLTSSEGLAAKWLVLGFVLACIAMVSRERSLFFHAQFYAEDGKIWFAQAYNVGWLRPLLRPDGGYFNTVQRLIADLALLVPLRWAPLAMALGGLFLQGLPVPILLSSRCRNWAPLPFRILFAAIYVGIPDAHEIHVVCTNSQWHLALAMILLAFAAEPRSVAGRLLDCAVILVGALSGPFGILLAPLLFVFWRVRRQRWSLIALCVLCAGSLVQMLELVANHGQRNPMYLGASAKVLVRLLGGNAFIGALLGSRTFGLELPFVCSLIALIVGLALIAACFRSAGLEFRLLAVFCFAIYAAGLKSPYFIYSPRPLWLQLLHTPSQRYSFFPNIALLFAILWLVLYGPPWLRIANTFLLAVLCIGIVRDWKVPAMPNSSFPEEVKVFHASAPGTRMDFPLYPPGWEMELIRK
ncbi:MAG TPA: hypothetical protein VMD97_01705 [Candidatus Aquilonibacter sp.]|nr:hypothetical protein [Candidatus Aquilonibacter sp.]